MNGYGGEEKAFASRAQSEAWTGEDAPTAFTDTVEAAFALTRREELSNSAGRAWQESNGKRAQAIGKLGGDEALARQYALIDPYMREQLKATEKAGKPLERSPYWTGLAPPLRGAYRLIRDYERQFPGEVASDERLGEEFKREAARLRTGEQNVMQRGSGWATFLGQAGATFTDPLVFLTAPFGGAEAGAAKSVLGAAVRIGATEGAIAAAAEIPIQAEVLRFKREIESPWTYKDSAMNVLAAGAGGAVIGGVVGGGAIGAKKALERYRAAKAAGQVIATPDLEDAATALDDTVSLHEQNPLEVEGVRFEEAHEQAFETARAQEATGQPVNVTEEVRGVEPIDAFDEVTERTQDPAQLLDVDPLVLKTDAQTFQYKTGADPEGVTSALRDVTEFDRRLAGVSLIWERADGARFVADGHQRLALAKRALAAGQDPAEVRLNGFVLREADGITAADARRIAAVKNMAEGTGSALDAAKILRDVGRLGEAVLPPLPPNSALVRQARGLARLDDYAFRSVINQVIPENFGALVGQATDDPKLQEAMIEVLRRAKPANETQARSIVQQVRTQGVETRTTEDLFGEQSFAESLYLERAQVLDEALKASRKDQAVFGRLVSEESRIVNAGENRLDREANMTRIQESKDAQTQITALANARGALSEALTAAARTVRDGQPLGRAAADFLQAARREILQGDRRGGEARRTRPGSEAAGADAGLTEGSKITQAENLSPGDRDIERRFAEWIESDVDRAISAYEKLSGAEGGRLLNTDLARELSPDYVADRTRSAAVHEPASWLVKEMYARALAKAPAPGQEAEVLFSAGGTGAGKSRGLEKLSETNSTVRAAQIIYDTNLSSLDSAVSKIEQALRAGKKVQIVYTWRDPVDSLLRGALPRAERMGRTVPIEEHAKTHVGAAAVIKQLAAKYADDARVAIHVLDNSHGKNGVRLGSIEEVPELAYDRVREELDAALESARAAGSISEAVYRGFKGQDAGRPSSRAEGPADRPGDRGQLEPQRARGSVEPPLTIDAAPRPIIRQTADERLGTPQATRTGTVSDEDYAAVMASYTDLVKDYGEFARVADEVNGQLELRSVRTVIEELEHAEDTLERIRLCSMPTRGAA